MRGVAIRGLGEAVRQPTEQRIDRVRSIMRYCAEDVFSKPQEYGTAVALDSSMTKPRRKDNGAPQNSGDTTAATIDRDHLAQRAYELYLARGGEDGRDLEDWLIAERELRERRTPSTER